jgi:hypothetical protein
MVASSTLAVFVKDAQSSSRLTMMSFVVVVEGFLDEEDLWLRVDFPFVACFLDLGLAAVVLDVFCI